MPSYVYEKPDGELVELTMTVRQMQRRQRKDGSIRLKDGTRAMRYWGSADCVANTPRPAGWPLECWALGVLKRQIPEAAQSAKRAGIPTEFNAKGNPIMTSPTHMRRYMNWCGVHHNDKP